jgi:hypothetical protein
MKHLIPYLQDNQKAADDLRQVRWPDGITCPRCGSEAVEPRERCDNGLQRCNCGVWLFCHDASNPGCSVSYLALSYNQDFPPETICSGGRALGISENLAW